MFADIKLQWNFFSNFHSVPVRIFKILIYTTYVFIFARPSMQFISRELLRLAMHGVGYDNWWSFRSTGEELFFAFLVKSKPVIAIDIGANKGAYSERLLNVTNAKVIAFEPQPHLLGFLREIKKEFPDRFFPLQKAIGDIDGPLMLRYGEENSQLASFCDDVNQIEYVGCVNESAVEVEVLTLDSFLESFDQKLFGFDLATVDLVKIDVEGFEFEVLSGAKNFVERCQPKFIQIEFNHHQLFRGHTFLSIASMLPQYNVFRLLPYGSGLARVNPRDIDSNIFNFSNFVFIRSDTAREPLMCLD